MLQRRLRQQVPELAGVPVLPVSALTGSGADRLLPAVMAAYDVWTQRVPTSGLNRWLKKVTWGRSCQLDGPSQPLTENSDACWRTLYL
jgi:predicted GTPase